MSKFSVTAVFFFVAMLPLRAADGGEVAQGQPELVYLFPLGGQRGTTLEVEVRGKYLDGTQGVWNDGETLKARVKGVEVVEPPVDEAEEAPAESEEPKILDYRVLIEVFCASTLRAVFPIRFSSGWFRSASSANRNLPMPPPRAHPICSCP